MRHIIRLNNLFDSITLNEITAQAAVVGLGNLCNTYGTEVMGDVYLEQLSLRTTVEQQAIRYAMACGIMAEVK